MPLDREFPIQGVSRGTATCPPAGGSGGARPPSGPGSTRRTAWARAHREPPPPRTQKTRLSLRILLTGGQTTEGLNADARKWTQMHANGPNGTAHRWPASKPRAAAAAARDGTEIAEAAGGICAHLRPFACICVRPSLLPCGTDPLREPRSALHHGTKHLRPSTDFVTRRDCLDIITNHVDGRSDNRRTQRRCTQMDADAREWTERNGPSVARLQAASSRCRRAGWDRDRRSGRRHLRPSASICVHLRSTFLTSLRDRSTPGGTFGPPPRNQTPPAFDRLRDEKGLFRRLGGFCGSTGTGLVIVPSSLGIPVPYRAIPL